MDLRVLVMIGVANIVLKAGVEARCNTHRLAGFINPINITQNLTSPNYPGLYPGDSLSRLCITTRRYRGYITVKILHLDIEESPGCQNDHLSIYEQTDDTSGEIALLCGNSTQVLTYELCCEMEVVFRTNNNSNSGTGFVLQYELFYNDSSFYNDWDDDDDEDRHRGFSSSWGILLVIVFSILAGALFMALIAACFCGRREKTNEPLPFETAQSPAIVGK